MPSNRRVTGGEPAFHNSRAYAGFCPNSSARRISMSTLEMRNGVVLYGSVCIALVLALMVPHNAEAQVLYGSIVGDVRDASGAAIPGATVTVTNRGTNLTRQLITDDAGRYRIADIPAGDYSVKVSQAGFKASERTEVTVSLNSVTRVDVILEVGTIDQTVTVSAETPALQTETSEVHVELVAKELQ